LRYILVDRFLELEQGQLARAVKCVTLGEPFLRTLDAYPSTLVLEGLLQTGGVLARASTGFRRMSVLGSVSNATFPEAARAGDRIEFEVKVALAREEGTLCEGLATVEDRVVGRAEFMIVYVPQEMTPPMDPAVYRQRRELMRAWGLTDPELPPLEELNSVRENS
jgi:3-hydroxyacyl-[acyl-carrier-protein] dehydratase